MRRLAVVLLFVTSPSLLTVAIGGSSWQSSENPTSSSSPGGASSSTSTTHGVLGRSSSGPWRILSSVPSTSKRSRVLSPRTTVTQAGSTPTQSAPMTSSPTTSFLSSATSTSPTVPSSPIPSATIANPPEATSSTSDATSVDTPDWQCIGFHESGNDYAESGGGRWQFEDGTWQAVTGLPGPAESYSPAVQDAAALKLYGEALAQYGDGFHPWTTRWVCGLG